MTLLMTALVSTTVSYASANSGQVTFEAGYREDNISWKHEFPSSNPSASTKLKFDDLDIFQIALRGRTTIGCNFYVRGSAYLGWILDGNFEHKISFNNNSYSGSNSGSGSGYGSDSFRHKNVIDEKNVFGLAAAIGYPFYFCDCTMAVAPVLGYSFDEQAINLDYDGNLVGNCDQYSNDRCCSSDKKFMSRWYGPFVGADFVYRPCGECWGLYAELEYHWGNFKGRRSENNSGYDFGDHRNHKSNAHAWVFGVGADYDICECWALGASFKYQDWHSKKHHHNHGYESNYSGRSKNTNKWNSYAINLTIGHLF